MINGVECKPPRMYDKWLELRHPFLFRRVKRARAKKQAAIDVNDGSERMAVLEEWLLAKVNRFAREVEYA